VVEVESGMFCKVEVGGEVDKEEAEGDWERPGPRAATYETGHKKDEGSDKEKWQSNTKCNPKAEGSNECNQQYNECNWWCN